MRKCAYGLLGLKPDEFWDLSLEEFNLMVEAAMERERKNRSWAAADVCATISGYRAKRVNIKNVFRQLTIPEQKPDYRKGQIGKLLAASNKRVKTCQVPST